VAITGRVLAVNISRDKGTKKRNIRRCELLTGFGLKGDAHGGQWHRQVSLLAKESIDKMRQKGLKAAYGDFAENITTEGIDLMNLPIGTTLRIGREAILRMTQKGKECHDRCAVFYQMGDCVMPREGVFAEVLHPGQIAAGDSIDVAEE
jgi:MOSC domain-containing protein YiiM